MEILKKKHNLWTEQGVAVIITNEISQKFRLIDLDSNELKDKS